MAPHKAIIKILSVFSIVLLAAGLYGWNQYSVVSKSKESTQNDLRETLSGAYRSMFDNIESLIKLHNEGKVADAREWTRLLSHAEVAEITAKTLRKSFQNRTPEAATLDSIANTSYYIGSFQSQLLDYYRDDYKAFELRTCKTRTFVSIDDLKLELERISKVWGELPQNVGGLESYEYLIDHWDADRAQELYLCI
ncbi:hypothetical protein ACX93W_26335 [Paenibacillus sp. CAU 1782]